MNITERRHQGFVVLSGNGRGAREALRSPYSPLRPPLRASAFQVATEEFETREADRPVRRVLPGPVAKSILLVDPSIDALARTKNVLRLAGDIEICCEFGAARARLLTNPPDLLITNLRLHDYNGLHLVHLAKPRTRCIVYSTYDDPVLAREVQAAGAFYERSMRLAQALSGYVHGVLPPQDRRSTTMSDRRRMPRGGRRSSDLFF